MKWRWILLLALMLSVGVNLGTLIAMWRRAPATPSIAAAPVQAAPERAVTVEPAAEAPRATTTAPAEEIAVTPKRGPAPAKARGQTISPEPEPPSPPPPPPTPREIAAPAEEARPSPLPAPGEPALGLADEPADAADPARPARPVRPVRPDGSRVGVPPPAFDRLAAELGLSADQSARFFAAQRLHVQSGRALQGRLQRSRIELAKLLSGESVDRATIDGLLREQAELQTALDRELATMLVEARGMLTPQQYRRYARMVLTRLIATGPGGPREAGPPPGPQRRPGSRRPRRFN